MMWLKLEPQSFLDELTVGGTLGELTHQSMQEIQLYVLN